ncbi:MAG: transcriptional repressor [Candidatus Magasanikbacteria bacterium]
MKDWMEEKIQEANLQTTPLREDVADWVCSRKGIFSAKELRKDLSHLDKVSVYRTLELFEDLDIIHTVTSLHGEVHYEVHGKKHHHHIVCSMCEKTACISCDVPKRDIKGFGHIHHSIIFTGLCTSCAAKTKKI